MAYKISGKVLSVGQPLTLFSKSGNTYTRRELVITVRKFDPYTGYPTDDTQNTPKFVFLGQQCQQLDQLKEGDIVVVHFDILGRAYEKDGKTEYFTEVRPFKVETSGGYLTQLTTQPIQHNYQQPSQANSEPVQVLQDSYQSNSTQLSQKAVTEAQLASSSHDDDLPF
ncbi:MAG: DUF3127 domain-containing protein [Bacteroidales bacterium]|nr:DUF3127 domain-containing protein [Bacteroidales bacterium]